DTGTITAAGLVASGANGVSITNTTASTLNLNSSAGAVTVTDSNGTGVTIIGSNRAGNSSTFGVTANAASLSVSGTITARSVDLQSADDVNVLAGGSVSSSNVNGTTTLQSDGTGNISLAGNVSGHTVDLTTSGVGNVSQTTGGITGATLTVSVGTGDVTLGSNTNTVGTLNVTSTGGGSDLTFNNSGALQLGTITAAPGIFGDISITAGGSITNSTSPGPLLAGTSVTLNSGGDIGAAGT